MPSSPLHFVDLNQADRDWVERVFRETDRLRAARGQGDAPRPLAGRTAALVFHKPSLRTRVSFAAGVHELGGSVVELGAAEVSLEGRESLPDVARVLSGLCDLVVIRTFAHRLVSELAAAATVPVVNALTDYSHPCQVLADLYTLRARGLDLDAMTLTWVGDGNNVLHSWLHAATLFGFDLRLAVPDGFEPDGETYLASERGARGSIRRYRDPREAVRGADAVYTDTWTSMGQESQAGWRRLAFRDFQVHAGLLGLAKPEALFLHCLPAHRGEEVTDEVIDGPQSVVLEQAENRLHAQKGLLAVLHADAVAGARGPEAALPAPPATSLLAAS
jgi:ornithine carbamoyltransferase